MADQTAPAESLLRAHDIGPAGSVVVAVEADDVRVRGVDGTTVRLLSPAMDHPAIEVAAGAGRYAVRLAHPVRGRVFGFRLGGHGFGLEVGSGTVELEVPRDARLEISTSAGDVSVRDVTGTVAIRTVSGDISLRGGGGDVRIEAASGNLRAVAETPVACTVKTVSGDVEIDAPRMERTSITTVSGDVEIASAFAPGGDHVVTTTSGDVELAVEGGVTIDVRTVSGDVGRDHPDLREHTSRRDPLVVGDGAARLAVRTLSGDIEVRGGRDRSGRVAGADSRPTGLPPGAPVLRIAPAEPLQAATDEPSGEVGAKPAVDPAATLAVLEALARGEIDVAEAERRLGAAINHGG